MMKKTQPFLPQDSQSSGKHDIICQRDEHYTVDTEQAKWVPKEGVVMCYLFYCY